MRPLSRARFQWLPRSRVGPSAILAWPTSGVAVPCLEIQRDPSLIYKYTAKGNLVAVVTNGTAVLD